MAGKKWLTLFLERNQKHLFICRPTGTLFAKAAIQHQTSNRIFNVDESGLTIVQSKIVQIIGLCGQRQIGSLTSAERGALITIVVCMSANWNSVPPILIFQRNT